MTEPPFRNVPWRRIFAESIAIVLSILLAFAIDAWWDSRIAGLRERDLVRGLLADFQSSRPDLEARLLLARRMAAGTAQFLDAASGRTASAAVTVSDSLVLAVLVGPTYEPNTNTLDAALASGEIKLLTSDTLRAELANWRRILADTREDELEVRRITNEQLVPALARTVEVSSYFDRVLAWSGGDPHGPGRLVGLATDADPVTSASVRVDSDLLGALALRKFYVAFAAADLEVLLASLDRTVDLLRR